MASMAEVLAARVEAKQAERAALVAELEAIPEAAETESRSVTDDEMSRSVEIIAAVKKIDAELAESEQTRSDLDGLAARAVNAAKVPQAPTMYVKASTRESDIWGQMPARNMERLAPAPARDLALRAMEQTRGWLNDDHKHAVMEMIERGDVDLDEDDEVGKGTAVARLALATSAPGYAKAWRKAMSGRHITDAEGALLERADTALRAGPMTSGTGSTGGYYVPIVVDPTFMITGAGAYSPMRQLSTRKTITGNTYYGATQAQTAAVVKSEGAAFTDETTTTSQISIPVYTYGLYIPASYEAWQDIDSLAQDIGELFMDAASILEATLFTTGSGTSTVTGVITAVSAAAGSTVTATTRSGFGAVDVFAVHGALGARYRTGSNPSRGWMATISTINLMRQFGAAYASSTFMSDLGAGQPPQLLGDGLYENSAMVGTLTTGTRSLIFGDFRRYYIVDRIGFQTEFIPNAVDGSGVPTGQRSVVGWWRTGGNPVDTAAFKLLLL